ncbi:response regulator [Leptolinea tardivitalis]|uniref:LuxR family transcriptional regulator n=1 Tax=Leptolinea tardivitalis TaxID=229920 RepID=A0A0P6WZ13_9CHLR|nr:response regulator transcription factor [Leptolinea tardivitalis]KPL71921.1 LuxR family transcriptional regulator [Leptolinea tardivitalis]GAP20334.1 two component transcriptional regulator, LuxR family [Leptolinea tardivitalis]
MKQPIRILLVDDQALFREGLRILLSSQPDFEVVAEAANGEEALRQAAVYHPDVVLMDLRMPVLDGVTATRRLHELYPMTRVIALTTFDEDEYIFEGLRAGAYGYLLKDVASQKLFEAIYAANRGEYFLMPSVTARVMAEFSRLPRSQPVQPASIPSPLSDREKQILKMVAQGASNKEIAEELVIAEGTVKNHLSNIFDKLEARDRMQAVIKSKELGII